jgi:hypothetical protein
VKIRDSVRIPLTVTVAAGGTGLISTPPVQTGQMLCVQSLAFRNRTGARGTATLQIRRLGQAYQLSDQPAPVANLWYNYPYTQYVNEGEVVEVSQASCSTSDVLDLVIVGYIVYKSEIGG